MVSVCQRSSTNWKVRPHKQCCDYCQNNTTICVYIVWTTGGREEKKRKLGKSRIRWREREILNVANFKAYFNDSCFSMLLKYDAYISQLIEKTTYFPNHMLALIPVITILVFYCAKFKASHYDLGVRKLNAVQFIALLHTHSHTHTYIHTHEVDFPLFTANP